MNTTNALMNHALDLLLRQNFSAFLRKCFNEVSPGDIFVGNWHLDAITYQLEKIFDGREKRLILNVPPRSLKSICTTVAFVAWCMGHNPSLRFMCVSYSEELAALHARLCHKVMRSTWYRRLFPDTQIDPKKFSATHFETTAGGSRYSTSVGGTSTGFGADIIIIDDPMKAADADSKSEQERVRNWFDSTLLSRLNDKSKGTLILVMQRLNMADLTGHLLEKDKWTHLSLPAIAQEEIDIPISDTETYKFKVGEPLQPRRETLEVLAELRTSMGEYHFSAQYLQQPIPAAGRILRRAWLQYYQYRPEQQSGDEIVCSWDTANKAGELNDYSVGTVWLKQNLSAGKKHSLLDVVRERLEYPDLRRKIIWLRDKWGAGTVLIEDKGSGQSLLQDLKREGFPAIGVQVDADKQVRFHSQMAVFEQGRVLLPSKATWLDTFLHELLQFPGARHDDQVDSVTQYLNWAETSFRWEFW